MKWFEKKKEIAVLPPLEGYNRWASSYNQESNPIKKLSDSLVEKWMPELNGKSFLDAGCGTGKFCALAEKYGASEILGLDLSPGMIEIAKKQCSSALFLCTDILNASIKKDHFDVITCALVLGHLESLSPALTNLLKGLRIGGTIIITDFHPFLTLQQSKRTFRDSHSGATFEVRHHLHLFQEYFKVFGENRVVVNILDEPCFQDVPVVFGILAQRQA